MIAITRRKWIPLLVVLTTLSCGATSAGYHASLLRIVANPESFDGRFIQVVGVISYGREYGPYLYHSKESARVRTPREGILLEMPLDEASKKKLAALNGKYVYARGIFHVEKDANALWHYGTMNDISRLDIHSSDSSGTGSIFDYKLDAKK
jgi:hypothetical protein